MMIALETEPAVPQVIHVLTVSLHLVLKQGSRQFLGPHLVSLRARARVI